MMEKRYEESVFMSPLMIALACICVILIIVLIVMIKKHLHIASTVMGFICAGLIAAIIALSIWEKPLRYENQTRENYLALKEDKNVSGFRIVVDGKITNRFPEWDDENPFSYFINYQTSEIRITTNHSELETSE